MLTRDYLIFCYPLIKTVTTDIAMLNDEQKKELLDLARSSKLRQDLRQVSKNRHNPFIVNNKVDVDRLLEFLTEYNAFINHRPKPFCKIIDRDMRI